MGILKLRLRLKKHHREQAEKHANFFEPIVNRQGGPAAGGTMLCFKGGKVFREVCQN